jgi:uncharacterized protein YijF (DUF1287 family)
MMLALALALNLGVTDVGIYPDLDEQITLELPAPSPTAFATVDAKHRLLVLWWDAARPVKAYPLGGEARLGDLQLRPTDAAELAPILRDRPIRPATRRGDADGDGIPDALDLVLGAKKVALNGASYGGDYIRLSYPGGDVPRKMGVCTDVIVRALRNAGFDLQKDLYEDIGRAPRAYPMVKKRDPNIDQRRVKTMVRWFARHWEAHGTDAKDKQDPFLPGDVVFFDTFPSKPGPDHVGIVSDRIGPSGLPLVVNNWTDGFKEAEMDLLFLVPVTDRYRVPASR